MNESQADEQTSRKWHEVISTDCRYTQIQLEQFRKRTWKRCFQTRFQLRNEVREELALQCFSEMRRKGSIHEVFQIYKKSGQSNLATD